ncbi:MAG: bifunctional folylpolyglutamate synthase/dihydrofolate synthase [Clostridia bacterium]|nr:bifunctional folylpolyglutamate synthase/dihydrofolate synthase [Clostridia bacterium]
MNYSEALDYIFGTLKFGSKLGLHNISYLLELMENPHQKLKFVHVAGTNGKGSTVAFTSSILMEAGYKVGIYTSPYLERFTERIKIGPSEIGEADLARITEYVKSKVEIMLERGENHPTEFEIVTAIAFQYYYENNCDIVVLEVGLGGRFDSTNVIDTPLVSVITTISYDHTAILGNTLPAIAFEKAGIIKVNGDVIVYPQCKEVEDVFRKACEERQARMHIADFDQLQIKEFGVDGQVFDYINPKGDCYKELKISLLGDHQVKNAVIAINTIEILKEKGLSINEKAIRKGLDTARWSGRLEVLRKKPMFIIDGAHNAEGAKILLDNLDKYFPEMNRIFIFGVLKDKDYDSIIKTVIATAHKVITVTPENERALPAEELAILIKGYCNDVVVSDTIEEAVETGLKMASDGDLICAFGSLYYIGEIRKLLNK